MFSQAVQGFGFVCMVVIHRPLYELRGSQLLYDAILVSFCPLHIWWHQSYITSDNIWSQPQKYETYMPTPTSSFPTMNLNLTQYKKDKQKRVNPTTRIAKNWADHGVPTSKCLLHLIWNSHVKPAPLDFVLLENSLSRAVSKLHAISC